MTDIEDLDGPFKAIDLNRDERLQILTLRSIGWSFDQIIEKTGATWRQVQYTCQTGQATPARRSGRPPLLTAAQIEELIAFICSSKEARRMAYRQLPSTLGWDVSEYAIRYALRQNGFARHPALRKPPISEKNRLLRLAIANERIDWTLDDWGPILWSDETWVTAGRHRKTWVTRRPDEAQDPTCIVEKVQRKGGWMFWGCFSLKFGKGPCLFWEKEWGTITAEAYSTRIVPLICGWLRLHPGQIFMQDNAKPHVAKATMEELGARGIRTFPHPPYSPDLNPIETVWNWMKDYIEKNFPEKMSYDALRKAVKEAWEAVPESFLRGLVESMGERMKALKKANGMHIPF